MSPIWVLPLMVMAAGLVVVAVAASRAADAGRRLQYSVAHLQLVRAELGVLRSDTGAPHRAGAYTTARHGGDAGDAAAGWCGRRSGSR